MLDVLKPLKIDRLKDGCVEQLEALILSGQIGVKQKLPPERDLARKLGVSRPVVHDALVDLAAKGLISLIPRVGAVVNDFRTHGSLALLTSLLNYRGGKLSPQLLDSLLAMRLLFETETARLAAIHRTDEQINELWEIHIKINNADPMDEARLTRLDFEYHHQIAMASANLTYPMFLNSFKTVYIHLSGIFFQDHQVVPLVINFHEDLIRAIENKNEPLAADIMRRMLTHGEEHLRAALVQEGGRS